MHILRNEKRIIRITQIVERFGVSNETARRDLAALQAEGLVKRIHGGGVLCEQAPQGGTILAAQPDSDGQIKKAIGALAATLVEAGDTIFLGGGSTMQEIARHLPELDDLTVLTASLPVAMELAGRRCSVIVLGGRIDPNEYCLCGALTNRNLRDFFVDKAFISAAGITLEHGATDFGTELDSKLLVEHARSVILCAQSSKFGDTSFVSVCPLSALHTIVSDALLPQHFVDGIRAQNIALQLASVTKDTVL